MRVMSLSAAVEVIESRIGCNDGFGSQADRADRASVRLNSV
jgi:hypothetical protein